MLIRLRGSSLHEGRWYEWLLRFVLGGLATIAAGAVAAACGPGIGGLFLALPAVFCASATLIESHEKRRKRKKGLQGSRRGQQAAALDAAGAVLGSIALMAFAVLMAELLPINIGLAFAAALAGWAVIALVAWLIWKSLRPRA